MPWQRSFTAGVLLLAAAISNDADALAQRTFVASSGADTNSCAITQPCRSFASAIALTAGGGEVIVLDSAGYGPVTISQSVSIIAPPGVYAGISVFASESGVIVAAGDGDKVSLRGLSIAGQGGLHGIVVDSAADVSIENCAVSNLTGTGIFILVTGSTSVQIRNTSVRSNGEVGLWVSGGAPKVQIVDSEFALNGYAPLLGGPKPGIDFNAGTLNAQRVVIVANAQWGVVAAAEIGATVVAAIADSMIAGNNGGAVVASSPVGGGRASLTIVRTTVTGNAGIGLKADGANASMEVALTVSDATVAENGGAGVTAEGATTRAQVTRSTVARNVGPDFLNSAGLFLSGANNTLSGRGAADTLGTITPNPPQ